MSHLSSLFWQLDALLSAHQAFWRIQPMQLHRMPWTDQALVACLQQLTLAQCEQIDQEPQLLHHTFAPFFPEVCQDLPSFPLCPQQPLTPPFWLANDIGGRKWQQITQFAAVIANSDLPVLEWCAGKGHLGRVVAQQTHKAVQSVEWQASLCQQGQAVAAKLGLTQQFVCRDVLKQSTTDLFSTQTQLIALHACGDLHRQALQQGAATACQELHIVPCCYHLQQETLYQPLSVTAAQSRLALQKSELKLAVQEHVTAGERIRKLRYTEVLWRRAFQLWRAEVTGIATYLPLSSVSKHWFSGEFAVFAAWAFAQQQVSPPDLSHAAKYLVAAKPLLLLQRQLELVQHLFRRPLELWLVLDRALFLEEQGYQVEIQQLCDRRITPRNLLISARRQPSMSERC